MSDRNAMFTSTDVSEWNIVDPDEAAETRAEIRETIIQAVIETCGDDIDFCNVELEDHGYEPLDMDEWQAYIEKYAI